MKKEKMSTGKKLKILSLIFVGVFIAVNLTWLFGILLPCMKFTKNMEYMNEGLGGYYFYSDDKYDYYVDLPTYLDFNQTFFRIEDKGEILSIIGENGVAVPTKSTEICVFVWPKFAGIGYDFGVSIEEYVSADSSCVRGCYIDENLNPIDYDEEYEEYAEEFKEMINKVENKQDVLEKLNAIEELWKISL